MGVQEGLPLQLHYGYALRLMSVFGHPQSNSRGNKTVTRTAVHRALGNWEEKRLTVSKTWANETESICCFARWIARLL